MHPELLKVLCYPETHQPVRLADPALVAEVNQQIAAGTLRNRAGKPVTEKIDGSLVRADGKFLYPIRQDIPVMLLDEAISLAPQGQIQAPCFERFSVIAFVAGIWAQNRYLFAPAYAEPV